MKKLTFRNNNGYYQKAPTTDQYLLMLSGIFDEGESWTEGVKNRLLNSESRLISGNAIDVIIDNDTVTIAPQLLDNPEDYAIEINKNALLNLIKHWQELVEKGTKEISFIRNEDGIVSISGTTS